MLHCRFDNPTIAVRENGTHRDKAKPLVCCANGFAVNMSSADAARRFPPPWTVEDIGAAFVVKDSTGQQLAYVYFEDELGACAPINQLFFGLQLPLKVAPLLSLNFRELLMVENCPWPASVKSTVSPALGQRYKTR